MFSKEKAGSSPPFLFYAKKTAGLTHRRLSSNINRASYGAETGLFLMNQVYATASRPTITTKISA